MPGWASRHALVALWLAAALASVAAAAAEALVPVQLTIRAKATDDDIAVSIHRRVAQGTDALAFMENTIAMEYKRYPGMGVFVTSLCGVKAPDGMFWTLSVNGERATRGIADLSLDVDTHIRWELVPMR